MSTETMAGRDRSAAARARGLTLLIAVALGVGALITAFPFFWMLATSVKPQREAIDLGQAGLPDIHHDPGLGLGRVATTAAGKDERQHERPRQQRSAHVDQESTSTAATPRIISRNSPDRYVMEYL